MIKMTSTVGLVSTLYAGGVVLHQQCVAMPASDVAKAKYAYIGGCVVPASGWGMTARFAVMVNGKVAGSQTYSFGRQRFMPAVPNAKEII